MSDTRGSYVWYELATNDVERAIEFYGDVVGWGTEKFGGPAPSYWIWTASGTGIGGLMALTAESKQVNASPHWVAYVNVADVDRLTKQAVSLGATSCVPPHDIPTVGHISMFADPQGAVLAMIKPEGADRPAPEGPEPGHVVWRELLTDDAPAALRFYGELFGWQQTQALEMGPNGTYHIYGKGGRELGGMMQRPPGYPLPPHWLYYVHVSDLDAALQRVQRGGGKVWMGPMPIPTGERVAQCLDPQGAAFALHGK
jgi:uncharacterized protein